MYIGVHQQKLVMNPPSVRLEMLLLRLRITNPMSVDFWFLIVKEMYKTVNNKNGEWPKVQEGSVVHLILAAEAEQGCVWRALWITEADWGGSGRVGRNKGWPDHCPGFVPEAIWRWCHPPWILSSSAGIDDLAGSVTLAEAPSQLNLSRVTFPGYQGERRERPWLPPATQWEAKPGFHQTDKKTAPLAEYP